MNQVSNKVCLKLLCSLLLGVVFLTGCNSANQPEVTGTTTGVQVGSGLPTVSIPPQQSGDEFEKGLDDEELNQERLPEPVAGTAEWNLKQIAIKRAMMANVGSEPGAEEQSSMEQSHYDIIDLAKGAIAMTHNNAEKQRIFDAACHALTEARLALAFSNHQEQVAALYEDAEAQIKRDPTSISSANATYAIVRVGEFYAVGQTAAPGQAKNVKSEESEKWAKEYVRAVKHFVVKFPAEESRGAVALFNAGKFCEARKDNTGAVECYALLGSSFPQSVFASQVTGVLRRLSLKGKAVELGGPTMDGGHVSVKDYVGKPVLVIFWDTQSSEFTAQVDQLIGYLKSAQGLKLAVIGVNLDQDELAVDRFLEVHPLPGPQIFPLEAEQRRYNSPIAKFYGIRSAPQFWLIDKSGNLVSSQLQMQQIPAALQGLQ
jgi:peroxiredoxin